VSEPAQATVALRRGQLEGTDDRALVEAIRHDVTDAADRAREILTERYQPLAIGQSASLHRGRGPDHEDVVSVAQHGLQKAIEGYDLGHGAPFAAYAQAKVRGEMLRWFRDDRYSVHVPRPLHERCMQVRRAAAQLETVLHRKPDVEEVAEHMDLSVARVVEAWAVDAAGRVRTDQFQDQFDAATALDVRDLDLVAALEDLDERARLLLYRRFWEGVSQREVGEELGVSQAHVSRLEQGALEQLKDLLGT
jgi:RNA polymerase sigma-B factor